MAKSGKFEAFHPKPKALVFDLMGTCLDWHSSILPTLARAMHQAASRQQQHPPSDQEISDLALDWRQGFFDEIHARFEAGEPVEDIDVIHRRVLERLMNEQKWQRFGRISEEDIGTCVSAWHMQQGEWSCSQL